MSISASILTDQNQLINNLARLCARPSSSGQHDDLAATASIVADLLRRADLDVHIVPSEGAPIVIGRRAGRSPYTVLLYHHYDVTPPGPWRAWSHEPFQLAERDKTLYGRGVAHGKGPLVAHIQAVRALLDTVGELPCNLIVVVEGEGLTGSSHLAQVIAEHSALLRADACLGTNGTRDAAGLPFCYSGSKGLLQVRLSAQGSPHPLVSGLASSVRNPAWRLTWALGHIKGEDEDIGINGFYDEVEGPTRSENVALRQTRLDEVGRLADWNLPDFLFGMSGAALVRAEATLPTCNLASFTVEPVLGVPMIPTKATAQLDFQLVPSQDPDTILHLLQEHLIARSCSDVLVEKIASGYPPVHVDSDQPFIQRLIATGTRVYGQPLTLLPLGPFTQPMHIFVQQLNTPIAVVALARNNSATNGANECLPIGDLVRHGQMLIALLVACGGQVRSSAQDASEISI